MPPPPTTSQPETGSRAGGRPAPLMLRGEPGAEGRGRAVTVALNDACTPSGLVLGRDGGEGVDVQLDHPTVSKRHARVWARGGRWVVTDLHSHNGVWLFDQRLVPGAPTVIRAGDRLRLGACVLEVVAPLVTAGVAQPRVEFVADDAKVRSHAQTDLPAPLAHQIHLLTEAAMGMGGAASAEEVTRLAAESLQALTGGTVAAVVKGGGGTQVGGFELLTWRTGTGEQAAIQPRLSRSVLAAALAAGGGGGRVVTLDELDGGMRGGSVNQLGLSGALAVPVLIDGAVAAVLYADNRAGGAADAAAFAGSGGAVLALSKVVSLALGRVRQLGLSVRLAEAERDLDTGRQAQQALLPALRGRVRGVEYAACFRPGAYVGGDFFDLVAMPDGRVACLLGDVCGHGVAAGLFMAVLVPQLRSLLQGGASPLEAVRRCNTQMACVGVTMVDGEEPMVRFATLWLTAVDPATGEAEMVDCGHGYAFVRAPGENGVVTRLYCEGGPPLGLVPEAEFASSRVRLERGATLVLVSDGAVEQPGGEGDRAFGVAALEACLAIATGPAALAACVESAVVRHSGTSNPLNGASGLQDDLTALAVSIGSG